MDSSSASGMSSPTNSSDDGDSAQMFYLPFSLNNFEVQLVQHIRQDSISSVQVNTFSRYPRVQLVTVTWNVHHNNAAGTASAC